MTVLDGEIEARRQHIGTTDLPDQYGASENYADDEGEASPPPPSLFDDLLALFADGKTYAQAEVAYQKSRAGFAANRLKFVAVYGAAAFGVFHLALIALTVGVLIALMPLVGPWFATAIVTLGLIVLGVVLLRKLKAKVDDIRSAFAEDGQ
ncbi:phage holin family protein [Erythrobacter sp. QSSC1-22B]|uniref:phage holin family protein n=1 Tax=Erythrobacter sp. QSSC1-22B TaxID=1860125 RepID=UPI0011AA696A|nr:phage holin family protein [Erythrobacter sp. QSSC1-22B]